MSAAFDPERIKKISNIVPNFLDFAQAGDEVHLGLEGDPAMPVTYRGTERPTGVITCIKGQRGDRVASIKLKSGSTVECEEGNTSPYKVWEFTDAGYKGVLARAEVAAEQRKQSEQQKSAQVYRGATKPADKADSTSTAIERRYRGVLAKQANDTAEVRREMGEVRRQMSHLHNIVLSVSDGLSRDIQALRSNDEPVFSGALLTEMGKKGAANKALPMKARKAPSASGKAAQISFSDESDGDLSD